MSTASKSRSLKPYEPSKPEPDPYRYGWRYVRVVGPDGIETFDQVPLTLEDVLFPEEGDFIVQTEGHVGDVLYLRAVFKAQLAGDPTAKVTTDCRVDWNLPGVRPLGPDLAVFFGVRPRRRTWATFNVAAEGARPALVVEVTSPETRKNDVGPKLKFYHRAKVPLYVIADATEHDDERSLKLTAYRYAPRGYQKIAPDAQGRIDLEAVGLLLGVTRDPGSDLDRLACYDPLTGKELGDYTALKQAHEQAEAVAREAKRQAQAARRQARIDAQARAEAEVRAEAEAKARAEAEARIRELEAELKRSSRRGP